ncbi:hypothetical protein [Streptomyces sp. WZ-12]|uniref:hypothetical protein n=1 Tax=Streptomyces sp. WZ-12 TaxID=3030210 RepID=UPI00238166F5|nr:hypothetical protein [Streptomyces sp. WZ-12]
MRSPQLALCAAVAACAVTTAPAHADDERGARTAQTAAATPAAPGPHRPPPTVAHGTRPTLPTGTHLALTPPARTHLVPDRVVAHRELSSTSAVALVLAGGVILVIAGQLLRLRLRLRRERHGSDGADED